jgi:hypothetical protein
VLVVLLVTLPKGRIHRVEVRRIELRMVDNVQRVHAQLETKSFPDFERSLYIEVQTVEAVWVAAADSFPNAQYCNGSTARGRVIRRFVVYIPE